ncbi:MAG TPA: 5-oxoprolinase subunit PxpB [Woeseiaceae bacterium]|nr:5-oxoprolinase subunit PxpB [Woeseiaceae bacterium]
MAEQAPDVPRLCGDDLVTVAVAGAAAAGRLAAVLREDPTWLEAVPGLATVVARFDATVTDPRTACERLGRALAAGAPQAATEAPPVRVPVRYGGVDGPDLEAICRELGLTRDAFVAAHTSGWYRVAMLGFTPGFAYVSGLDERLSVGRLERPRQRVPAGSVGIAGAWTGLYALAGPGGWPLIGRTPLRLFDPAGEEPFRLAPGQRIRFEAIGRDEDAAP